MLYQNTHPVTVMGDLKMDEREMASIMQAFITLDGAHRQVITKDSEKYLDKAFGAEIRDRCEHYVQERGICDLWKLYNIDPDWKSSDPSVFKGLGKYETYNVQLHPEICVKCRRWTFA